ncbi:MAG: signal peptidase I [Aigarchaeota archaeon]|nr:signal peptidase I [Aigarchaeota archaeon]MDW7985885.1 signal peptidase I [Nitrososphaerota archaeon]
MKTQLLTIFIVTVALLTLISVADDLRVYRIVSPSMEPSIPVGSLVIVSITEPIEVGDIVAYKLEVLGRSYTLVHRVVEIMDGAYLIRADVDSSSLGEIVKAENIIGKVILAIPFLGYLAGAIIAIPAILILLPLIASKGGVGFPTAAFISFLPSIFPLQGLALSLGNIFFTLLTTGVVIIGRMIEYRDKDIAEIIYTLAAAVSIINLNISEVVRGLAQ